MSYEKVTALTPEQANFAIGCVCKWINTCEDNKRGTSSADASHSSLLYRLMTGHPLLEVPPPRAFSYPHYEMVEKEECQIRDLWERPGDVIYHDGDEFMTEGPVVVVDQCAEYVWEKVWWPNEGKKILQHVPSGRRWEYFEKTAYPIWVAVGKVEDHPYMGKFLRRLPDRYTLNHQYELCNMTSNSKVREFGTLKQIRDYIYASKYSDNTKLPEGANWAVWDNAKYEAVLPNEFMPEQ